jgi:hypothetical protein
MITKENYKDIAGKSVICKNNKEYSVEDISVHLEINGQPGIFEIRLEGPGTYFYDTSGFIIGPVMSGELDIVKICEPKDDCLYCDFQDEMLWVSDNPMDDYEPCPDCDEP